MNAGSLIDSGIAVPGPLIVSRVTCGGKFWNCTLSKRTKAPWPIVSGAWSRTRLATLTAPTVTAAPFPTMPGVNGRPFGTTRVPSTVSWKPPSANPPSCTKAPVTRSKPVSVTDAPCAMRKFDAVPDAVASALVITTNPSPVIVLPACRSPLTVSKNPLVSMVAPLSTNRLRTDTSAVSVTAAGPTIRTSSFGPGTPAGVQFAGFDQSLSTPAHVRSISASAAITIDIDADATFGGDALSVTTSVNVNVPGVVGVPVIAPVPGLRNRPGGKLPSVIAHVRGSTPPCVVTAAA